MPKRAHKPGSPPAGPLTQLGITVRNHPGVMSHVCGLFSRRAFNMEAIMCMPVGDGRVSRIWLLLPEDDRLPQVVKQLDKLQDVLSVEHAKAEASVFLALEQFYSTGKAGYMQIRGSRPSSR